MPLQRSLKSLNPWQLALALLFAVFLAASLVTFSIAARRASKVVDADYYSHGLHYGKTPSGSSNPGLNWHLAASLRDGRLKVSVTDGAGAPVEGGTLHFQPAALPATVAAVVLAESTPGVFTALRPLAPEGDIRGTLLFTRGEAVATQKLVLFH